MELPVIYWNEYWIVANLNNFIIFVGLSNKAYIKQHTAYCLSNNNDTKLPLKDYHFQDIVKKRQINEYFGCATFPMYASRLLITLLTSLGWRNDPCILLHICTHFSVNTTEMFNIMEYILEGSRKMLFSNTYFKAFY